MTVIALNLSASERILTGRRADAVENQICCFKAPRIKALQFFVPVQVSVQVFMPSQYLERPWRSSWRSRSVSLKMCSKLGVCDFCIY